MNNVENAVERHYWRAVTFLVILILAGAGFWGLRRFAPAMFLGKPDLIAVPNNELPQNRTTEHRTPNRHFLTLIPLLSRNSKPSLISARRQHKGLWITERSTATLPA